MAFGKEMSEEKKKIQMCCICMVRGYLTQPHLISSSLALLLQFIIRIFSLLAHL